MERRRAPGAITAALALAGALTASAALAGGYGFHYQGSRAAGLAGAFTAVADDPSAIYYNPGGLMMLEKDTFAAGVNVFNLNQGLFQGLSPGDAANTTADQDKWMQLPLHAYLVQPVGEKLMVGIGTYQPFLHETEWLSPGDYPGRFVSTKSSIRTLDISASGAVLVHDAVSLGAGVVYRLSDLEQSRRLSFTSPFSGLDVDAADLFSSSDPKDGFGFTLGLKVKPNDLFSFGVAYRSAIEIDYVGTSLLTQVPTGNEQLDAIIAATLPFDEELAMSSVIEFPDVLSAGVALSFMDAWLVALDVDLTGWSSVQVIPVSHPNDEELDYEIQQLFDDTTTVRLGVEYRTPTGMAFQAGVGVDESPQPDTTVGPFLADADSTSFSVGAQLDWLEAAFVWTTYDERTTTTNLDGINGRYRKETWFISFTVSK